MFSPKSKSRLHRSGLSSGVRTESSFQRVADERWAESLTLPQRSAHWALDEGDPADPIALSIGELSLPVVSDSDLGNLMRAEMHYKHSILQAGPQGHRVSAKGFADAKVSVLERDLALILDFPHDITGTVFNRRQNLRKAPRADLITAGWYCHAQRLVWPLVVIDLAPLIEPGLRLGEILQDGPGQHLGFQGAVEPFLLALSLGMARPPMAYPDSQSQQPNRQRRCRDGPDHCSPTANHCPSASPRATHSDERLWSTAVARSLLAGSDRPASTRQSGNDHPPSPRDDTAARCPKQNAL